MLLLLHQLHQLAKAIHHVVLDGLRGESLVDVVEELAGALDVRRKPEYRLTARELLHVVIHRSWVAHRARVALAASGLKGVGASSS